MQRLSASAAKAKARRDLRAAKSPDRKAKKAHSQRERRAAIKNGIIFKADKYKFELLFFEEMHNPWRDQPSNQAEFALLVNDELKLIGIYKDTEFRGYEVLPTSFIEMAKLGKWMSSFTKQANHYSTQLKKINAEEQVEKERKKRDELKRNFTND